MSKPRKEAEPIAEARPNWLMLPEPLLLEIALVAVKGDPKTCCVFRTVCKTWNEAISHKRVCPLLFRSCLDLTEVVETPPEQGMRGTKWLHLEFHSTTHVEGKPKPIFCPYPVQTKAGFYTTPKKDLTQYISSNDALHQALKLLHFVEKVDTTDVWGGGRPWPDQDIDTDVYPILIPWDPKRGLERHSFLREMGVSPAVEVVYNLDYSTKNLPGETMGSIVPISGFKYSQKTSTPHTPHIYLSDDEKAGKRLGDFMYENGPPMIFYLDSGFHDEYADGPLFVVRVLGEGLAGGFVTFFESLISSPDFGEWSDVRWEYDGIDTI